MNKVEELNLILAEKSVVGEGIIEFRFASPSGDPLPNFDPGSHIGVSTPYGSNRQYSLINSGDIPDFYQIAVKREPQSRGGSSSMHDDLNIGDTVTVQAPNNSFPLVEAPNYLFIGGGIGITPLISMARKCFLADKPFLLIYCARSAEQAAYAGELKTQYGDSVIVHLDSGDPSRVFDFWDHFMSPSLTQVYCCGPKPLMEEIKALSGHWPEDQIHFEDFNPQSGIDYVNSTFTVSIQSTGQSFEVNQTSTILDTLRANGFRVPSSCESGTCGSCKMKLVSGEVEHRDFVLESDEYDSAIMVCVSRGKGNVEIDFEDS